MFTEHFRAYPLQRHQQNLLTWTFLFPNFIPLIKFLKREPFFGAVMATLYQMQRGTPGHVKGELINKTHCYTINSKKNNERRKSNIYRCSIKHGGSSITSDQSVDKRTAPMLIVNISTRPQSAGQRNSQAFFFFFCTTVKTSAAQILPPRECKWDAARVNVTECN